MINNSLINMYICNNGYFNKFKNDIINGLDLKANVIEACRYCQNMIMNLLKCIYTKNIFSECLQALLIQQMRVLDSFLKIVMVKNKTGQDTLSRLIANIYIKIRWIVYNKGDRKELNKFVNNNGLIDLQRAADKMSHYKDYNLYRYLCYEPHSNLLNILPQNVSNKGTSIIVDNRYFWNPILIGELIKMLANEVFFICNNKIIKGPDVDIKLINSMNYKIQYIGEISNSMIRKLRGNS